MSNRFQIQKLTPEQWSKVSETTHKAVFDEIRKPFMDRIDYALVIGDTESDVACGYMTAREVDGETVYWQYGGSFPTIKGTINTSLCYGHFLDWHRGKYKRVITLVENDNISYLKLAMHHGFRIIGVRVFDGIVLLELMNKLEEKKNG